MKCFNDKSNGFTLIELVIVIVILGILAVTAAPKFIKISSDSKAAVLKAVKGSFVSIDKLVYAKSVILGIEKNDRNSSPSNKDPQGGFFYGDNFIHTKFGHPWIYSSTALEYILDATVLDQGKNNKNTVCLNTHDFCMVEFYGAQAPIDIGIPFTPGGAVLVYLPSYTVADDCFAYFIIDRPGNTVLIGDRTSGC